ncbi:uncharacterized protein LOC132735433 [Ruditapes philippinarum]|uniref:uncharacterized protein LOC132735433 n=1 Tax=Ruditapes philippinarum TaxID=129788 RepID=UPI00295A913F|nr:uncharacterized protein LOC132735433 [Ruditapes philippinarum]
MAENVPGRRPEKNTIEYDAELVEVLLSSARAGQWQNVWRILGEPERPLRDRLFNVIPENRRWGILHQAVYWNKEDVIRKLLRYQACDKNILAKQCTSECGRTDRMNAEQIAQAYGYTGMSGILSTHKNSVKAQQTPTFQSVDNYTQGEGLGLITVSLAAYKKTFHPTTIDPNKSVITVLGDIFNDINRSDCRWKEVRDKVCDAVFVVCEENYKKIKSSKSRNEFFEAIINTYTMEENYMYTYLNIAFRRQRETSYLPTGNDLSLGPYAVMYQMLLLFWSELQRESRTTYRKMLLTQADCDQYVNGKRFVWQSVVSSSTEMKNAIPFPTCGQEGEQSVIFTIDNRANSQWQPRNIEKYAMYMKHERTYPAGAKFQVTGRSVKDAETHVSLKLLTN